MFKKYNTLTQIEKKNEPLNITLRLVYMLVIEVMSIWIFIPDFITEQKCYLNRKMYTT